MLTDRALKTYPTPPRVVYLVDANGLYVRVYPTGSKVFVYRRQWRTGAKTSSRWIRLGEYPQMSLLQARRAALDMAGQALPERMTVAQAWDEFDRRVAARYASRSHIQQRIKADLLPRYGSIQVSQLTRAHITQLLTGVVDRGAPVQANRLLGDIKLLLGYSVQRGWCQVNVAEGIRRKIIGGAETSRKRALTLDEVGAWWQRVASHPTLHVRTKLVLGLLATTGQRMGEVLELRASEIQGRWWTVPVEHNKSDRANHVYLNAQARWLLRRAFDLFGDAPFGFGNGVAAKALRRMGADWTPHDLRRTMATVLAEHDVAPHVIEAMLNHALPGVAGVYNRARYEQQVREAWQMWGRVLARARKKRRGLPGALSL